MVVCVVKVWWKMDIIRIRITMLYMLQMWHRLWIASCLRQRFISVCVCVLKQVLSVAMCVWRAITKTTAAVGLTTRCQMTYRWPVKEIQRPTTCQLHSQWHRHIRHATLVDTCLLILNRLYSAVSKAIVFMLTTQFMVCMGVRELCICTVNMC